MIIKLKSFVVLLSFMLFSPYLVWGCGDYRTSIPPIMKTWRGYFDPQITFYNDCGSHTLSPGSIRYLSNETGKLFGYSFFGLCSTSDAVMLDAERSNVSEQYRSLLDKKKLFLYSGKKYYDSYSDSSYNKPCICVAYVTIGTYDWDYTYFGNLAGPCIILPMPPGPPPFTDVFANDVTVNIVPDSNSSIFLPRLRAVFRKNGSVYCANTESWIPSTEKCSDGSNGDALISVLMEYRGLNSSRNSSNSPSLNSSALDSDVDYTLLNVHKFKISKRNNFICGKYYGLNYENDIIFEQCYQNSHSQFSFRRREKNRFLLMMNNREIDFSSITDISRNITDVTREVLYNTGDPIIYVFDAALDHSYFLKKNPICLNAQYQKEDPLKDNVTSKLSCNEGYSLIELYSHDKNSNMRCIYPISQYPSNHLLLKPNSKGVNIPHHIRHTNYVFMPYSFSQKLGKYVIDTNLPIIRQNDDQDVLNTMRYLGSEMFSITKNGVEATYKYEPEQHYMLEHNAFTDFVDRANNPIFLSKTDLENLKPLDPHLNFQCDQIEYDFLRQKFNLEYDEKYQSLSYDPKSFGCDAVKIQAWGGGSAAKYDDNSSYTGANGGFIEGTVYLSNPSEGKNMLKITIGRGGRNMGKDGDDTVIQICSSVPVCKKYQYRGKETSICDVDESTCQELITAKGGSSNPKALFIDSQRIIMPRGVKSLSIRPESDQMIPDIYDSAAPDKYLSASNIQVTSLLPSGGYVNKYPSTGGYVNKQKKIWQAGGDGVVQIKCEIWKKDGVKTLKENPFDENALYNEAQLELVQKNNISQNIPKL